MHPQAGSSCSKAWAWLTAIQNQRRHPFARLQAVHAAKPQAVPLTWYLRMPLALCLRTDTNTCAHTNKHLTRTCSHAHLHPHKFTRSARVHVYDACLNAVFIHTTNCSHHELQEALAPATPFVMPLTWYLQKRNILAAWCR